MATSTIKAVNETISITGNGAKTRAQLLNELFALVDITKVTEKTVLNMNSGIYSLSSLSNTGLTFDKPQTASSFLNFEEVRVSSNSSAYTGTVSSSGYSRTDESSTVIPSGYVIKLVY
jgi:hypothetical protein